MSEERQQGPGRGGWWKSPWGFGAQGLVGSLWLVGALYVTVSLISDTGEPGVLGSIAALPVRERLAADSEMPTGDAAVAVLRIMGEPAAPLLRLP